MVRGRRAGAGRMVKAQRPIPPAVRDAQARASNPAASAFVSANAGSGKTHVLVQRVIRLLLDGVPPQRILCITFTKAAAAEMANRVDDRLSAWAVAGENELTDVLTKLTGTPPDARRIDLARALFARVLEVP